MFQSKKRLIKEKIEIYKNGKERKLSGNLEINSNYLTEGIYKNQSNPAFTGCSKYISSTCLSIFKYNNF